MSAGDKIGAGIGWAVMGTVLFLAWIGIWTWLQTGDRSLLPMSATLLMFVFIFWTVTIMLVGLLARGRRARSSGRRS